MKFAWTAGFAALVCLWAWSPAVAMAKRPPGGKTAAVPGNRTGAGAPDASAQRSATPGIFDPRVSPEKAAGNPNPAAGPDTLGGNPDPSAGPDPKGGTPDPNAKPDPAQNASDPKVGPDPSKKAPDPAVGPDPADESKSGTERRPDDKPDAALAAPPED